MAFVQKKRNNFNRRYKPMKRLPRNFKKFHQDQVELQHRHNHNRNDSRKTKVIKKGRNQQISRNSEKKNKDSNDLDREMREYWIKSGHKKGKEEGKKDQNLAVQKMN